MHAVTLLQIHVNYYSFLGQDHPDKLSQGVLLTAHFVYYTLY